ncbi:MAG: hypothetical protein LBD15_02965 [Holosporales bacterium]|nr:hypothetical protein [Holosporales bacterium]
MLHWAIRVLMCTYVASCFYRLLTIYQSYRATSFVFRCFLVVLLSLKDPKGIAL